MIQQKLSAGVLAAIACLGLQTYSCCSAIAAAATSHVVNVKTFGAKGDGVTDDQAALEAAFQYAASRSQVVLFFPPGRYIHSDLLTATNTGVVGSTATLVGNGDTAHKSLELNGKCVVSDMGFEFVESSFSQTEAAIIILTGSGTTVSRCNFNNVVVGIQFADGTTKSIASNCTFTNQISGSFGGVILRGDHNQVVECRFVNNNAGNSIGIQTGSITNGVIHGCTFSNVNVAVLIASLFGGPANFLQVDHNVMQVGDRGITGNGGTNLSFTDNRISPVAANSGTGGIAVNFNHHFDNVQIRDNSISGFAGNGIDGAFTAANIQHNLITNCGGPGIDITDTSNGLNISLNALKNCGLTTGPAVIFVESGTGSVAIRSNTYTGNTSNLDFFIRSVPNASLSGNVTNTGLGNRIGP
ncbi:MAG TPA: right-handed parallel beta-helix repeat-containing protein [Trichormus sp.]